MAFVGFFGLWVRLWFIVLLILICVLGVVLGYCFALLAGLILC